MKRIAILDRFLGRKGPAPQAHQQQRAQSAASHEGLERCSVHFCGGCGAAFLVDGVVAILPVDLAGTAREFCACCHDFLGERLASRSSARSPGYDDEGQSLNVRFPGLTPTEKRHYRGSEVQFRLEELLREYAARSGVQRPDPLFLSS